VLFAAEVWHWWIGVVLVGGAVLTVLGIFGWYLYKVQSPRYGGRRR
jgi:hypothetical protein